MEKRGMEVAPSEPMPAMAGEEEEGMPMPEEEEEPKKPVMKPKKAYA